MKPVQWTVKAKDSDKFNCIGVQTHRRQKGLVLLSFGPNPYTGFNGSRLFKISELKRCKCTTW